MGGSVIPWRGGGPGVHPVAPAREGLAVFLHMEGQDQAGFLDILVRNDVRAVLDCRPVGVFAKPRFRHREVVAYLFGAGIRYIEAAMHANLRAVAPQPPFRDTLGQEVDSALRRGLLLCLRDGSTEARGWSDPLRHLVRTAPGYRAELNPRSLDRSDRRVPAG